MIKSKVYMQPKSIKLVQDETEKNIYYLDFKYDALCDVKVGVYYCAKQVCDAMGVPMYFLIHPELPKAHIETMESGQGKSVERNEGFKFDVSKYQRMPLFKNTRDYFPILITIEPSSSGGDDQEYQNVITYGVFRMEESTHTFEFKGIEQRMINGKTILVLQEIFGLEIDQEAPVAEDDESNMCVICISEDKSTVVMPCGHLCICKSCATEFAKKQNPLCPICRVSQLTQEMSSFVCST